MIPGDEARVFAAEPAGGRKTVNDPMLPGTQPTSRVGMTPAVSLYLDVWRVIAAFGVMIGHVGLPWISARGSLFPDLGHELVIVFFFLSGFVIADATLGRRRSAVDFAAARLSRMYSVVLPALVLTALAIVVAARAAPELAASVLRGHEGVRLALAAVFLQETWFLSASPATNAPLWSLGYEFWFYVLFGVWVYAFDRRWRWGLTLVVAAMAGPKILLLLPAWLAGVAAWWLHVRGGRKTPGVGVVAVGAIGLLFWLWGNGWCAPGGPLAVAPWYYSGRWLSDLVLSVLFGAHVLGCGRWWGAARVSDRLERPIRALAGITFSLYAYHYPLLIIGAALPIYDPKAPAHVAALACGTLGAVLLLHRVTEARRRGWQERFARCLARIRPPAPQPSGLSAGVASKREGRPG
jgi:peptidoglycan/LPS O-acetylase OafA/YrhL